MEIFKQLKELGYKHYIDLTIEELDKLPIDCIERRDECSLVIDWLRKEHNIDIQILRNKPGYNEYRAEIYKVDNISNYTYLQITEENSEFCKWFHIFEDAREQAILRAIDLIKNN